MKKYFKKRERFNKFEIFLGGELEKRNLKILYYE